MSVALAKPCTVKALNKQPTNWSVQAKLDGVRAIWRDGQLLTRTNKIIHAPDWFCERLEEIFGADQVVDGELIHEKQIWESKYSQHLFQDVVSTVRKKNPKDAEWHNISFCVFDIQLDLPYRKRLEALDNVLDAVYEDTPFDILKSSCGKVLGVPILENIACDEGSEISEDEVKKILERALSLGFEGVMWRDYESPWLSKRTDRLLKSKPIHDAEATVVAVQEGEGKYRGMVGALICEDAEGRSFKIGTGLTDEERDHPPGYWIDRYITYSFTERTRAGMPRHPSFVCIRDYE